MTIDQRTKNLVAELYAAKQQLDEAQRQHADVERRLLMHVDESVKTIVADTITATVIRGSRLIIDEDRLKKQLGATIWNKITQKVLDKQRLEAAIALGDIDPNTVAMVSEERQNKPYFKFKVQEKSVTKSQQEKRVTGRKAMSPHSPRRIIKK